MPEWLNFEGTRSTYLAGLREDLQELHPRESWHLDWERMSRPGNIDVHDQLFHDYRKHVARFGEIAEYNAAYQPPCLVLWGRHDELITFDAHIYDAGHFLLETHSAEVTDLLVTFVDDVCTRARATAHAGD